MKKFVCLMLGLFLCISLNACVGGDALSVSFQDITGAGSTVNTVKATFVEEKDYKNKYTDILLMSEIDGLSLRIAEENGDYVTIVIPNKDIWYSLTALIYAGKGESGKEDYEMYKEISCKTYIIQSNIETPLKLKAVVGTTEDNAEGGKLLVNRTDVSYEFELKLKKYTEK